jgi:hypothetical protein
MLADRCLWPVHTRLVTLAHASVATGCVLGSLLE